MNKNVILKFLNVILAFLFLVMAGTGIAIKLISNPALAELHEKTGPLFIGIVLLHFALNFSWVKATYFKKKK